MNHFIFSVFPSFQEAATILTKNGFGRSDFKPEITSQIDEIFSKLKCPLPFEQSKIQVVQKAEEIESEKKEMISELLSTLKEFGQLYVKKVEKIDRDRQAAGF